MVDTLERIPPQNLDAEKSTIGSMLLDREAITKVCDLLRPEDFYREAHGIIYSILLALFEKGEPVDLVTVTEELRNSGDLEKAGGIPYLTSLVNSVPTSANVEYYARIVEEKAVLRGLINAGTQIVSMGYETDREVLAILDEAEQRIFRIAQKKTHHGYVRLKNILTETFERIEKLYETKGGITGIPTGFSDFDQLTAGLQPSDLIILASRPSMGKTTFAMNIAQHVSVTLKQPVIVFSLEMSKEQLAQKLLCSEAGVDSQRLRTGHLTENDWPRLSYALGRLSEALMYIDDTPGISVMEMRAKARRIKADQGLSMIIIDYLQLMQGRNRVESRQQEVSEISRSLKALARELQVPVLALSQLSRAVEQRSTKIPTMADLRESGSLEQDADIVAFLYREEYYQQETDKKGLTELHIAKHRNGPVGKVDMLFQKEYSKFVSLEKFRRAE
ncbi:MAG: replicative DNA helicase [Bacillota bacterium]